MVKGSGFRAWGFGFRVSGVMALASSLAQMGNNNWIATPKPSTQNPKPK